MLRSFSNLSSCVQRNFASKALAPLSFRCASHIPRRPVDDEERRVYEALRQHLDEWPFGGKFRFPLDDHSSVFFSNFFSPLDHPHYSHPSQHHHHHSHSSSPSSSSSSQGNSYSDSRYRFDHPYPKTSSSASSASSASSGRFSSSGRRAPYSLYRDEPLTKNSNGSAQNTQNTQNTQNQHKAAVRSDTTLSRELSETLSELRDLDVIIKQQKATISFLEGERNRLQEKFDDCSDELRQIKSELDVKSNQILTLESQKGYWESQIQAASVLEDKIKKLEENLMEQTSLKDQAERELFDARQNHQHVSALLIHNDKLMNDKVLEYNNTRDALQFELDRVRRDKDDLKKSLMDVTEKLNETNQILFEKINR